MQNSLFTLGLLFWSVLCFDYSYLVCVLFDFLIRVSLKCGNQVILITFLVKVNYQSHSYIFKNLNIIPFLHLPLPSPHHFLSFSFCPLLVFASGLSLSSFFFSLSFSFYVTRYFRRPTAKSLRSVGLRQQTGKMVEIPRIRFYLENKKGIKSV